MRVLIADDSAVMRKVLQRALAEPWTNITDIAEAANGREALEYLRHCREVGEELDLILCDINMPVMDGLTFLESAQAEGLVADTPTVIVTTESGERMVLRAIAAGARGYICKPFTAEQVRDRITPLLHRAA